jgi:hypothetical protein
MRWMCVKTTVLRYRRHMVGSRMCRAVGVWRTRIRACWRAAVDIATLSLSIIFTESEYVLARCSHHHHHHQQQQQQTNNVLCVKLWRGIGRGAELWHGNKQAVERTVEIDGGVRLIAAVARAVFVDRRRRCGARCAVVALTRRTCRLLTWRVGWL